MEFSIALILIAFMGLLGATWGSPLISIVAALASGRFQGNQKVSGSSQKRRVSVEFLIPAHNEERILDKTLASILSACRNPSLGSRLIELDASVTVALDHCTDRTLNLVQSFDRDLCLPVTAMFHNGQSGKWNALKALILQSRAEWVALVDSGSVWERDLLVEAAPYLKSKEVVAVAPSYSPMKGGTLEKLLWKLEQHFKQLETLSGGPVSVHGASVLYRREELIQALEQLDGEQWLNDDVVIPFAMRVAFPSKRIVYLSKSSGEGWVRDVGIDKNIATEYRRRRRMVLGNLQWVALQFCPVFRKNPFRIPVFVAMRRLFRLFWAYWALLLLVGGAALPFFVFRQNVFLVGICAIAGVVLTVAFFRRSNFIQRLCMAFLSGLQIPLLLASFFQSDRGSGGGSASRGVSWA